MHRLLRLLGQTAHHLFLHAEHLTVLSSGPLRMVVPKDVKDTVQRQPSHLLVGPGTHLFRLPQCLRMPDVHVAQRLLTVTVEREGEDIRDLGESEVFSVEPRDLGVAHERDRQLRTGNILAPQRLTERPADETARNAGPFRGIDVDRDQRSSPLPSVSSRVRCLVPG